jgi:hypothetical protein
LKIFYTLNYYSENESYFKLFKRSHIFPFLHLLSHKQAFSLFFLDLHGILTFSFSYAFFNYVTQSIINLIIYLLPLAILISDFESFTVEALFGENFCLPQLYIAEIVCIVLII